MPKNPMCQATRKDGSPCQSVAIYPDRSPYCKFHDQQLPESPPTTSGPPAAAASSPSRARKGAEVRAGLKDELGQRYEKVVTLLDAATDSTKTYAIKCPHPCCSRQAKFEVPFPDIRAQLEALKFYTDNALGRPEPEPEQADLSLDPSEMTAKQRAALVAEIVKEHDLAEKVAEILAADEPPNWIADMLADAEPLPVWFLALAQQAVTGPSERSRTAAPHTLTYPGMARRRSAATNASPTSARSADKRTP